MPHPLQNVVYTPSRVPHPICSDTTLRGLYLVLAHNEWVCLSTAEQVLFYWSCHCVPQYLGKSLAHTHICMYALTHTHSYVHTHTGTGSIYIDMLICACPQHTQHAQECTIILISYMQYCISYSLYTGLHVQCVVVCVWFYCCLVLQGLAVRRVPSLCTKQENLYSSHWPWWRRTEPSPSLPCTFTSYDCYATYTATTHCCIQTTAAAVL